MLGQVTPTDQFAFVGTWLAALAVAFGPGGIIVAKLVDGIRYFDKDDDPRFKIVWIVAALVIGLVVAFAGDINLVGDLFTQLPAFADNTALDGTLGTALTGLGIGASASFWHERMDLASSKAEEAGAVAAGEVAPPVVNE
jgi:hypothetical protein